MQCLWLIWCCLIWTGTLLCIIGCLSPYWLAGKLYKEIEISQYLTYQNDKNNINTKILQSTLNLFRRCVYPIYKVGNYFSESEFESIASKPTAVQIQHTLIQINTNCGYYTFSNIPHLLWKLALFILIFACCLLIFVAFLLSFMGFYLQHLWQRNVQRCCQVGLLIAGSLVLLSCILFPVGWYNNHEFRQICGRTYSRFDLGYCQIGWAYLTTVIGGIVIIVSVSIPNLCYGMTNPVTTNYASGSKRLQTELDPLQIFTNSTNNDTLYHQLMGNEAANTIINTSISGHNINGQINFVPNCEFIDPNSSTLHVPTAAATGMDYNVTWFRPCSQMSAILPYDADETGRHVLLTAEDLPAVNQHSLTEGQLGNSETTINSLGGSPTTEYSDKKEANKMQENSNHTSE